jgi:hypothetical protein
LGRIAKQFELKKREIPMDEWQKEFWAMIATISTSVEEFVQEIGGTIEAITQEVQQEMMTDIETIWQDWIEPMIDLDWDGEDFRFEESLFRELLDDSESLLTLHIPPTLQQHPACMGCHHYHGHVYSGNLLVCGMHPYGWTDDHCPDWDGDDSRGDR